MNEKWTEKETFETIICHEICADLFPGFEYGNKPEFTFEEICEFGTELLKRLHLYKYLKEEIKVRKSILNHQIQKEKQ